MSFSPFPFIDKNKTNYNLTTNQQAIALRTPYGSLVNGYQPQILRPFDNVSVPRQVADAMDKNPVKFPADVKRDTFEQCNWPCSAGSNYQTWCSEENAQKYYAMRPIIEPNDYNNMLKKMFTLVVDKNASGITEIYPNNPVWTPKEKNLKMGDKPDYAYALTSSLFCNDSIDSVMKFIMQKIAIAVSKMPEMKRNSSWVTEQFHYTDPQPFQFIDPTINAVYYKIVFNLYNPLRSTSTLVQTTVRMSGTPGAANPVIILDMDFVNTREWDSTGMKVDGIASYNDTTNGISTQYNGPNGPNATEIGWNYGNTLLDQKFNKYGFFEDGANVDISGGMSDNMRQNVRQFQDNATSYLLPCNKASFNGLQIDSGGRYGLTNNNDQNTVKTVYSVPQVVYEDALQLKQTKPGVVVQMAKPGNRVIGIVNT
jgi:hypothetical protein